MKGKWLGWEGNLCAMTVSNTEEDNDSIGDKVFIMYIISRMT